MRIQPSELRSLDLRAHDFLDDVPLHDVWKIRLRGSRVDLTMPEALGRFVALESGGVDPVTKGLFTLRRGLGRLFGWDDLSPELSAASYVSRLSRDDRASSLDEPGSTQGFWTTIYTFPHEALGEVINRTVHAFLLFALVRSERGHTLYWAIYVKPVSRFTPLYMRLIDPFRRWIVYPSIIRRLEAGFQEDG